MAKKMTRIKICQKMQQQKNGNRKMRLKKVVKKAAKNVDPRSN